MTLTANPDAPPTAPLDTPTARTTGLLYLAVGVTGMLGFFLVRSVLFDPDSPAATAANLVAQEPLARVGIALEMALAVAQTLAALWFYRLFRSVDRFAAGAIAVFGTVNAVAVLASAAFLASALDVATDPVGTDSSHLMYVVSGNLWGVGNLFFGLWLIPMGLAALRSGWAPRLLGPLLVAGGAGFLVSALATYLLPDAPAALPTVLVLPATAGEFWMIGWLLFRGLRRR